jgi:hypothetical protein
MSRIFTRRSMLLTSAGLPALAVGSSLLGGSSFASAAPAKASKTYGAAGPTVRSGGQTLGKPLRPLAEQVLQKARHAFTIAAANPKRSFAKGGMAAAAAKFMKAQSSVRVKLASARAGVRLSSGDSEWKAAFGPYAKLAPAELEKALSPGEKYGVPLEAMVEKAATQTKKVKIKREKPKKYDPDDFKAKPRYERIAFHLNRVKCIVDTNEFDSDEIRIGGHLIRPDGNITNVANHLVHDDFDPGDVRNYDHSFCIGKSTEQRKAFEQLGVCAGSASDPWAGRVLASAPLVAPWPGTFGLVLLMVEEDHGGMNELLSELYARIKDELDDAIASLGEATGDAVAEYLGEDVGAIVNEIVVWVLTELVAWVVSLFDNIDDPISGESWIVTLPNRTREAIDALASGGVDTPSGSCGSKIKELVFQGDGGKYRADLHWRAIA